MRSGDIIELGIESIAFGGAGVGRHRVNDRNFVIFVEDSVPGDIVKVRIGGKKRSHAFGYITEFVKKAENRITPRCKHFGMEGERCGGCSLQNLNYSDQLKIKEQNVRDAITRIGGFDESTVLPITGCENEWFYRNKMEFSFSRDEAGKLTLGLHVRRRHHDVTGLSECFLFADWIGDFVKGMREFFIDVDEKGFFGDEMKPLSLVVREGKRTGEIMVNLIIENGVPKFENEFTNKVKELLKGRDLKSIYLTRIGNKKGSKKTLFEKLLDGERVIHEKMEIGPDFTLEFEILPQSFFQPNTLQAEKLFRTALDFADPKPDETVYDLYCGAGTISLALSKSAKKIYGIELNKAAIVNANNNAKKNNIVNVEFLEGDAGKRMPDIGEAPDLVVVDPPRGGLHEDVIFNIADLKPRKIVYVSCNPSTLARDLKIFNKTGYTLLRVQPVDMFPQTYHIECVAELTL